MYIAPSVYFCVIYVCYKQYPMLVYMHVLTQIASYCTILHRFSCYTDCNQCIVLVHAYILDAMKNGGEDRMLCWPQINGQYSPTMKRDKK